MHAKKNGERIHVCTWSSRYNRVGISLWTALGREKESLRQSWSCKWGQSNQPHLQSVRSVKPVLSTKCKVSQTSPTHRMRDQSNQPHPQNVRSVKLSSPNHRAWGQSNQPHLQSVRSVKPVLHVPTKCKVSQTSLSHRVWGQSNQPHSQNERSVKLTSPTSKVSGQSN